MFETSVIRVQARAADRRLGLLTVSVAAHAAVIVAIVAAGLTSVKMPNQAPDQVTYPVFEHLPPALGTPDAKPAAKPQTPQQPQAQRVPAPQTVVTPSVVPSTTPQAASSTGSDTQTTGSSDNTGPAGVPWGSPEGVDPDGPPAASTVVEPTGPLVAGVGDVKAPVVLRRVSPPYPHAAMMARMNGYVIVECIIDKTGVVRDAKVLTSSSKLFEQAALDAVQQWQFAPGSLHGRAVDTIFNLTVTFQINR